MILSEIYSEELCRVLDSPSLEEIHQLLKEVAGPLRSADVLTIFFSGHGGIHGDAYYLAPCDYDPGLPSMSGLSLAWFIRFASDLGIKTLNIVIDACQSAASSRDLREAIERPVSESQHSPAVSILVSSKCDQPSITGSDLSPFTKTVCDLIRGNLPTENEKAFLSLGDFAPLIPTIMHRPGSDGSPGRQEVAHYALNILGTPVFCTNPLRSQTPSQPHNPLLSPYSSLGEIALEKKSEIQTFYREMKSGFSQQEMVALIRPICEGAGDQLSDLVSLLGHYQQWFGSAGDPLDWGVQTRVASALTTAALPQIWSDDLSLYVVLQSAGTALAGDLTVFRQAAKDQDLESIGLYSNFGIEDFYLTPVRLSEIYSRVGLALIADHLGLLPATDLSFLPNFIRLLIQDAGPQHLLLNEVQGPLMGLFFAGWKKFDSSELIEEVFGPYLNDHWQTRGFILRDNCTEEHILSHLGARTKKRSQETEKGIARPNTTLPIFLLSASLLGLQELVDPYLAELNGLQTSFFVPANGEDFHAKMMETGCNLTKTVGTDLYSCAAYAEAISRDMQDFDNTDIYSLGGFAKCLASFVWRDRFPFPLLS